MRKVWALVDIGEVLLGQPFETQEAAQTAKDNLSYFGDMLDVREINFNDEPLDEEGEELKEQLKTMLSKVKGLHLSKGVKFYEMSLKERYRFMINMLDDKNGFPRYPFDEAPKSSVEPIDVVDLVKKL